MVISLRVAQRAPEIYRRDEFPPGYEWIVKLKPLHQRLLFAELHQAVLKAAFENHWQPVVELLEDWAATAEVDANPELAEALLAGPLEKEYQPWKGR